MGWTNVDGFPHLLFPASAWWVLAADLVGLVAVVIRRNRVGLFIAVMGGFSAAVVCLDPQGKLYNVRFLPFWFLCLYLMAGYALAETVSAVARWNRRRRLDQWVVLIRQRLSLALRHAVETGDADQPLPAADPGREPSGRGGRADHRPGRGLPGGGAAPGPSGLDHERGGHHRGSQPSRVPGPIGTTRATSASPTTPSTTRSSR